jgi:hypothetical protein
MKLEELLFNWIKQVSDNCAPGVEVKAINIGIFETESGYSMYVTGSQAYDPNDDDWVLDVDYEPNPSLKYLEIPPLLATGVKWDEILVNVHSALKTIVERYDGLKILKNRVITTGFDDGELIRIA